MNSNDVGRSLIFFKKKYTSTILGFLQQAPPVPLLLLKKSSCVFFSYAILSSQVGSGRLYVNCGIVRQIQHNITTKFILTTSLARPSQTTKFGITHDVRVAIDVYTVCYLFVSMSLLP